MKNPFAFPKFGPGHPEREVGEMAYYPLQTPTLSLMFSGQPMKLDIGQSETQIQAKIKRTTSATDR